MPADKEVYLTHANRYELLILREDHQNNISPPTDQIRDITRLDIVKLEAGTARLTQFLAADAQPKNSGTGYKSPHLLEHLDGYFRFPAERGLQFRWFHTDHRFDSLEETVGRVI